MPIQILQHSEIPSDIDRAAEKFLMDSLSTVRRWSEPAVAIPTKSHVKKGAGPLSERVLGVILANRFCRTKGAFAPRWSSITATAVANNLPIPISIVCGPLKNRKLGIGQSPDWAEVFLYAQLARVANAVGEVYHPGISVEVILDDARAGFANQVDDSIFEQYRINLRDLLEDLGLSQEHVTLVKQRDYYQRLRIPNYLEEAESLVNSFRENSCEKELWDKICRNSCENNCEEVDSELAAHRYLVAQRAEILAGFWENDERIMLRYGQSPDSVPRLWSIRKGSTSLPWQGIGSILLLQDGELRSCVWQPYRDCGLKLIGWTSLSFSPKSLPSKVPLVIQGDCQSRKEECSECSS